VKDKVSLITGSTSGIGLGIARALADAGSDVVLNGFGKPEEIEAVQGGVAKDFGVRVSYSGADMSNPESIAEMIATALRKFGRLDVLVNNAGIQHVAPLHCFRQRSGMRSLPSISARLSTPRDSRFPR
jgi:3-hydroxybutyrate dehydrogenase